MVAAFHFINLEAALILLFFNLIFICLTFELNGTPRIKLGMLALGNVVGLLCNIVLFSFAAAGSAYFGETFNILCDIARPFLNFMWIISFWSLSLSVFPKPEKPRTEKSMILQVIETMFILLTAIMVVYLVRHYVFTLTALRRAKNTTEAPIQLHPGFQPTVSILIPAHNEEKVIGRLLQWMTELTYPKDKLQVTVIKDGSSDTTGEIADRYANRYKFINVLQRDKRDGDKGKATAMNAGFKQSTGEIILCFDADYCPQKDIVEKLTREFVDPNIGAVQGRVVVLNEPQNIVTRLVALERIGGYRVDQEARDKLNLIPQFGGTVGGLGGSSLENIGGWDESILAEDTDLTPRACLAGYKIRYVGNAECYEEAVDNWRAYWNQRYRWARGHMQCCLRHSGKVLKSKKLSLKEKIDGLLLLHVYFMPIISLLSSVIGVSLILCEPSRLVSALWLSMPIFLYSVVGNFAPFFEVGVGAYLDGRTRIQWLIPLLIFTFLYNIPICAKAFLDLLLAKVRGNDRKVWVKTPHLGNGNSYIMN